jgi:hypothetical protein
MLQPSGHGGLVDALRKEYVWIVRGLSQACNYLAELGGSIL